MLPSARCSAGDVRAAELGPCQLTDAAEPLANGVPVKEQLARDAVHAAVKLEIRLKRSDQIDIPLVVRERSEHALRVGLDVALGLSKYEAKWTEVVEVGRLRLPAVRPRDRDRLVRLKKREMCTGRAPRFGRRRTESSASSASFETLRRSRSPSLRASTSASTSKTPRRHLNAS